MFESEGRKITLINTESVKRRMKLHFLRQVLAIYQVTLISHTIEDI